MDHGISGVVKWYASKDKGWKRPWGTMWDGTKIFIVDGPHVREKYFVDYVEGGHGYVYKFIPKGEIWIEDMENKFDQGMNLLHEIYELTLMKYVPAKKEYDPAHDCSANVESLIRESMAGNNTLKPKQKAYRT